MPTQQVRRVCVRTASRIRRASPSGSVVAAPTNASSHPITSTTVPSIGPKLRRTAITSSDAASYAALSAGRKTASGQRRAAVRSGIPEWTPYSRAA